MRTFAARRFAGFTTAAIISALLIVANQVFALGLQPVALYTGWLLLGMVLFLAAFNLRKKLPFLPLGTAAGWLQLHIYIGLLAILVFGLHVSWRIPNGIGEGFLAASFVIVAASGVVGLILSRVFARRLTSRGGEILWDRIARLRGRLSRDAERAALDSLAATDSPALLDFYLRRLRPFFTEPKNFWAHLVNSTRPRDAMLEEIDSQRRYLSEAELEYVGKLSDCVKAKDDLDYQFALQATLKYWLFLHVPLTYVLIVLAIVHVLMVYAY